MHWDPQVKPWKCHVNNKRQKAQNNLSVLTRNMKLREEAELNCELEKLHVPGCVKCKNASVSSRFSRYRNNICES